MSDSSPPPTPPAPITDSPWFWVLVFSAAGTVALAVIFPRYQARQRKLEMQYLAREEILRRNAEGEPVARAPGQEGDAAPPATGELIIPIWPLSLLCGAVFALSWYMLLRSRRALSGDASQQPAQSTRGGPPS